VGPPGSGAELGGLSDRPHGPVDPALPCPDWRGLLVLEQVDQRAPVVDHRAVRPLGHEHHRLDTKLRTTLIIDQAAAEQARFPGSPTVRVDGRDVEPGAEPPAGYSLACRLYG
jgi:hypothetical protein